jgi:ATP-binding cassette subfamily F protein uup
MGRERVSNLVNLEAVAKSYGPRLLLDGVSIGVGAGDRIGVVGRNGAGKSTLLRLIARTEGPDAGRVTHASGLRVAMVAQDDRLDPASTIRAAVVGDRPEHDWAGQAAACSPGCSAGSTCPGSAPGWTRSSGRAPAASGGGSRWPGN